MSDELANQLTADQVTLLTELAESENARLEEAASLVTQQAFNLGCFVGLLPGGLFLLLSLLLSDFSIIGAAIALVLILLGLIAFANLSAMLARRNTIRRVYREQSLATIERTLRETGLNRAQFEDIARKVLPPHTALFSLLPPPPIESERSTLTDEAQK
jgi:predicted lipid-binding transport protein (Tim44 family)